MTTEELILEQLEFILEQNIEMFKVMEGIYIVLLFITGFMIIKIIRSWK